MQVEKKILIFGITFILVKIIKVVSNLINVININYIDHFGEKRNNIVFRRNFEVTIDNNYT